MRVLEPQRGVPAGAFSPLQLARLLTERRDLIRQLARREIEGRYRGSLLGTAWSFVQPLGLLVLYTYVFGVVLRTRWPDAGGSQGLLDFGLAVFCGLVAFNLLGECVGRAATLVTNVPNYVRKVVFPLEALPVAVLLAALVHALAGFAVLVAARAALGGAPGWTVLLLPLVVLPLVPLALGVMWFLASLGVYFRDVGQLVPLLLQLLFFLTPIVYPPSLVPERLRFLLWTNPLARVVEDLRGVLLWGRAPEWSAWLVALGVSLAVMQLGYAWFVSTRKGFADVL